MATGGGEKVWTWKKPLPPSKATLRKVFENTSDLSVLCSWLSIPDDKRDVDSAVEYYVQSTDPMKMRKMIFIWTDWRHSSSRLIDGVCRAPSRSIPQSTPPHTSLYCHIWRLGEDYLATLQYQMPGLLSSVRSSVIVIKSLLRLGSTTLSIIMIPAGKTYPSSL
ncbi:hypothetical protein GBAR_LOCUS4836 [Geodia barretti]|uniref:Uncharacterized protein n=1 Tax=Geodia barretti TaxID=519541 RepID=A0AA35R8A6_GEOBA|nr:hypothetical protein GBAR_LOCUS4836 [Geodia barretti]